MNPNQDQESLLAGSSNGLQKPGFLTNFLEIAFEAIIAFDAQERITFWNPAAERMYGWTADEAVGKTSVELFWPMGTPRDQEEQRKKRWRLVRGETVQGEYRPCRKDGSLFWVEYSARAIFDGEGGVSGYVAVYRDLTERKHTENEIRLISKMPAENPNPVMRLTPDGNVLYANNASSPLLESWKRQLDKTIPDELQRPVAEVFASSLKREVEIGHNGKTFSFTLVPIREAGYINLYGKDVTERKLAEEALRQSEERFRTLANAVPSIVWTAAPDGMILYSNDKWYEYTGISPEQNARDWPVVLHPDDYERCVRKWTHALETVPDEYLIEVRNRRHDGEYRWFQTRAVPARDSAGNVVAWYGVTTDIHERIEHENRLVLLSEISEMMRKYEDPDELLSAVSEAVGEHLHVRRCLFNEIDLKNDLETVRRDNCRGVESVAGVHKISDYSSITSAEMMTGKTVVNYDSKLDPRTARDYDRTYAPAGERAYVAVPMMRENRWVASLWVSDDLPRWWSKEEVFLLESVAERTWTVIEKLRIAGELRTKEAELERIINHTPFMLTRCSRDLRYRFVSRAYAEMIGRTPEEIAGQPIVEIIGEEGLHTVFPYIEQVLKGNQVEYESRVPFEGGKTPFLHVAYIPDRDEHGEVIGWFASIVDISERRRIEQELERERFLLEQLFQTMPVMVSIYDPGTNSIRLNTEFEQLIGWKSEEVSVISLLEALYPDPEYRNYVLQRMAGAGKNEWVEIQVQTRDGRTLDSLWSNISILNEGQLATGIALGIDITERKRAEESLRRNEKMFSTLVESAPFGVYFIDSEFRLQSINKGSEAVFSGIHPLIGRDFAEILRIIWQEPFATEAIERFRHTLLTGESFISPTIIEERANIEEIQAYDWQIHRISLSDGTFGVVCYFYDLSEQKRMEATVRASQALYRTIARSIPGGGVYVIDKDFRYIVAEGPVTEAFGFSREMLEGHTISEVFPKDAGERMKEHLLQNFAGETVSFETKHNGRVYWTQQAPLLGSIGHAIVVTIDITERKQAEEALRQSEERFARFMQHLPGLAWIKDVQGRYVYANAAAEQAFRTPREKLYGKTDHDIFPPEVAAQFKKNDDQALIDGKGLQVIETLQHENGVLHFSLVSKFPIPGLDGTTAMIGGTAFDITERKRAEEALHEHQKQLQYLNQTLEQRVREQTAEVHKLASDLTKAEQRERNRISHILHDDLQQRLYAIQMQMAFLTGGLEIESAAVQRDLAEMKEQLDEVLALTRHLSIDLSPPILRDEGLTQAISWLASQMQEQQGLHIDVQAEESFALADEDLQVLLFNCVRELLFNIVKHAGVNRAVVALQRSNADLRIEVHDEGRGFDFAMLAQHPSDRAEEDKPQKSSFGLPTLRHRLGLFGGRMDIASEPGAGTLVTLMIPVYKDEL